MGFCKNCLLLEPKVKLKTMRKYIFTLILIVSLSTIAISQVAVNTDGTNADPSAILDVKSSDKGMLIPRLTLSQRDAISNPADGLMIYQTDNATGYYLYSTKSSVSKWRKLMDEEDVVASTLSRPLRVVFGNYTIINSDYAIMVNGNHTITLPQANAINKGKEFVIRAYTGIVTIQGGGSQIMYYSHQSSSIKLNEYFIHTGNGHNSANIHVKTYAVTLISDGIHWVVISDHTYTH